MEHRRLDLLEQSPAAAYHLLTAIVVPRPIAWISTLNEDGSLNLAPFSFFNVVCANPPLAIVGIGKRKGEAKDTSRNLHRLPECVIHIPTVEQAGLVQSCAEDLPYGESEQEQFGLTVETSLKVQVPRICEARVQLECKVNQWLDAGQKATDLILLNIVEAHVQEDLFDEKGRVSVDRLAPLARTSSGQYAALGKGFKV